MYCRIDQLHAHRAVGVGAPAARVGELAETRAVAAHREDLVAEGIRAEGVAVGGYQRPAADRGPETVDDRTRGPRPPVALATRRHSDQPRTGENRRRVAVPRSRREAGATYAISGEDVLHR